ncbi:protein max isoform X2 [Heterocephalus glaber]|uniref:Protein max n=1 Tax=Heterocephalus glaber TaxID=10181 RepID=A0AAX6S5N6_HETGA|nr:protein max isoform X2 [Heterocephalus glaber]
MSDNDDIEVESDEEQPRFQSAADKRAHHNALERKRRDHIKDSFHSLRDSVPSLQGEKASRAQILDKATEYIQYMRRKNHTHQQDIDDLKRQNALLEQQGEHLSLWGSWPCRSPAGPRLHTWPCSQPLLEQARTAASPHPRPAQLVLELSQERTRAAREETVRPGPWTDGGFYLFWPALSFSWGSGALPAVGVTPGIRYLKRALRSWEWNLLCKNQTPGVQGQ